MMLSDTPCKDGDVRFTTVVRFVLSIMIRYSLLGLLKLIKKWLVYFKGIIKIKHFKTKKNDNISTLLFK